MRNVGKSWGMFRTPYYGRFKKHMAKIVPCNVILERLCPCLFVYIYLSLCDVISKIL